MIGYVIPTMNREARLQETLRAIGSLGAHRAKVFVVDNNSDVRPEVPVVLESGVTVERIDLPENCGAAGRNVGVEAAVGCEWVVMLDDDSHPLNLEFLDVLAHTSKDTAGVMADIVLPHEGRRESGGLPEVFIGCGVAIRRDAFLDVGGYDSGFGFYAEEYDLAAKFLLAGWRMEFEPTFHVDHHKVKSGRDMGMIVRRLVRNSCWVAQRYAPLAHVSVEIAEVRNRYRQMAEHEGVVGAYEEGIAEMEATLEQQPRSPMSDELFDRFTGLEAARDAIGTMHAGMGFKSAMLWKPGKNFWVVRRVLAELGVEEVEVGGEVTIVGTMSPGPMLDAGDRLGPLGILPWRRGMEAAHRLRRAG